LRTWRQTIEKRSRAAISVIDAWAALAWLKGEGQAAVQVRRLLLSARRGRLQLIMSVMNLGEVYYRTAKVSDEANARLILDRFRHAPVVLVPVENQLVFQAASLKARFPISYADSFAAALAVQRDARLVTGDPDFRSLGVASLLRIQWLARTGA
jgi:ribonuclease VapC